MAKFFLGIHIWKIVCSAWKPVKLWWSNSVYFSYVGHYQEDGGKDELDPHHRNYNTDEEHPYISAKSVKVLKVLSSEMDPAEIRFIRKAFYFSERRGGFIKIRLSPILWEPLQIPRHLIQLLTMQERIANARMKFITSLCDCTGRNEPEAFFAQFPAAWSLHCVSANIAECS